ncbi:MAG: hypothetical protein RLZZ416_85 [Candidatus Parcubacteria bacterium]|jgi:putative peptidoglycan lipid II flippase
MMNRALRLLSWEIRGLQAAVYILAVSSLLSSILALLRDRLLAHTFGAGAALDLYYAAFRIPDLIFVAAGALVSVYILIPALSRRDEEGQRRYIDTVIVGFLLLSIAVSLVAAALAPIVLPILFPQFSASGNMDSIVLLTRVMLLQPILLGLSNILAALTQSRHRYALYSISPLLYNLGIILGVMVFYPMFGLVGLAFGVVCGAFMHVAIQLPSIIADGFFQRLPRLYEPRALLETAWVSLPRSLALSMNQIAFLGLTALASGLASGSIAIFMFAYNLEAVPLSIIGASYSVAAFPFLAKAIARQERELFIDHIATAARYVIFWSLPATALIVVLRAYLVRLVLGSGQFDWTDTRLTAAALALFALALVAQGLTLLLVRGYYAAGRTFVPFFVALLSSLSIVAVGGVFLDVFRFGAVQDTVQNLLRVANVPGSSVLALALAYSLVTIISTIILIIHFESRFRGFLSRVWLTSAQSLMAASIGGGAAYLILSAAGPITLASTTLSVFLRLLAAGGGGGCIVLLTYALLQSREFDETLAALRARVSGIAAPKPPDTAVVTTEEAVATANQ